MPSYKDEERLSPTGLAKYLLKDHICKNCKWREWIDDNLMVIDYPYCMNNIDPQTGCFMNIPSESFGCNKWEKDVK